MKAEHLRLNNIVKVDWEDEHRWCALDFWEGIEFEPIPLTEEWLERFGCKKQTSSAKGIGEFDWYELPNGMDLVWVLSSKSWVRIETVESVTIKHVHQLQNLYFALTGEELQTDETEQKVN